jgi:two-component system chemotaxis family response regulator WspR
VVDIAARYGGDEYMVIASNTTATDGVSLGERIRAAIKSSSGNTISVSIGVADLTALKQVDVTTLCQAADEALYQAKLQGRNRVALSQPPPANPGAA